MCGAADGSAAAAAGTAAAGAAAARAAATCSLDFADGVTPAEAAATGAAWTAAGPAPLAKARPARIISVCATGAMTLVSFSKFLPHNL
jgi:phosphodiesterase/alkaline phosphatase D-like protein